METAAYSAFKPLDAIAKPSPKHRSLATVIITRRSLLASLGLALPVAATATRASATTTALSHHGKRHGHLAHLPHAKSHRTASLRHAHGKQA